MFFGLFFFIVLGITSYDTIKQRKWDKQTAVFLVLVVAIALTLQYNGHTLYWYIYEYVPGFGAIRALTRIGLVFLALFGFLIAFQLDRLRSRNIYLYILVVVLAIADQYVGDQSICRLNKNDAIAVEERYAEKSNPVIKNKYIPVLLFV
jgi:glucan phosphoethanolaminetransferase (alkaline phosphatase superfamily)